jgi:catechol-2,3-dioxygenase
MFDHVMLNVSSRTNAMKFYTPVLQVLRIKVLYDQGVYTAYGTDRMHFWLREAEERDVTRKAHLAFSASSREQVDQFHKTPGLREHGPKYYAAYVFDLEGNNIEAVCTQ